MLLWPDCCSIDFVYLWDEMAPGRDGNNSLAALIIGDYSTVYFMAFSLHSPRLCAAQIGSVIAVIIELLARRREGFLFTFHATQFYWQFGSIVWRLRCVWKRFLVLSRRFPKVINARKLDPWFFWHLLFPLFVFWRALLANENAFLFIILDLLAGNQ